ncbi:hypothetical protein J6590_033715 [Homalodisca vitripennis]|nr:hypothetical protein J6590_033715 [Homalodisca vitripennis]
MNQFDQYLSWFTSNSVSRLSACTARRGEEVRRPPLCFIGKSRSVAPPADPRLTSKSPLCHLVGTSQ